MTDSVKNEEAEGPRDARGRWRKGHCPNPKGRPRKRKNPSYNPGDIHHFMNTQVELTVGGEVHQMDRKAALYSKMFETAMKGRVSMQRHLMSLFEKSEAELSEMRQLYNMYLHDWILDNPDFKSVDESLTQHQWNLLLTMAASLNHRHPGQFEELQNMQRERQALREIKRSRSDWILSGKERTQED